MRYIGIPLFAIMALLSSTTMNADAATKAKKKVVASKTKSKKPVVKKPAPAPIPPLGPPPMPNLVYGDKPVAPINAGLNSGETLWHLRAALNVAALSCRAPQYALMGPNYNKMLKLHKATLLRAVGSESTKYGNGAANDRHQTQLYNFYASPVAQAQMCWSASGLMEKMLALPSASLESAAPKFLAELEAPFNVAR